MIGETGARERGRRRKLRMKKGTEDERAEIKIVRWSDEEILLLMKE